MIKKKSASDSYGKRRIQQTFAIAIVLVSVISAAGFAKVSAVTIMPEGPGDGVGNDGSSLPPISNSSPSAQGPLPEQVSVQAAAKDAPTISWKSAPYSITEDGGSIKVKVKCSNLPSSDWVTVEYTTNDGSAKNPGDYGQTSGLLTFSKSDGKEQSIRIPIGSDTVYEGNEEFSISLRNAVWHGPSHKDVNLDCPGSAQVTIIDDDPRPDITFSVTPDTVNEGNDVTLTTSMIGDAEDDVVVNYALKDGSADGNDYNNAPGQFVFVYGGPKSQSATVATYDDNVYETDEQFNVGLSLATDNAELTGPSDEDVTIKSDDPMPEVWVSSDTGSFSEGDGTADIKISMDRPSDLPVTIDYATVDNTAKGAYSDDPSYDYICVWGTLTIEPGQTDYILHVPIIDDDVFEEDETFTLVLSNATGAVLRTEASSLSADITITDNDAMPVLSLEGTPYVVDEGAGIVAINVVVDGNTELPISLDYATFDNTAKGAYSDDPSYDYICVWGTLTIEPGQKKFTLKVPIIDNNVYEADESLYVMLDNLTGATFGSDISSLTTEVTIKDDDQKPVACFDRPSYAISEDAGTASISVILTGETELPTTVSYVIAEGTAKDGQDFTMTCGKLTFQPGENSKVITVDICNDDAYEADETIMLYLCEPVDAIIGSRDSAILTITNDDPYPAFSFDKQKYTVGETGGNVTIRVVASGSANDPVYVSYVTENGSAVYEMDYNMTSGSLIFNPGDIEKTFTIKINDDNSFEGNEDFFVHLMSPDGTKLASTQVVIEDDDHWSPPVSIEYMWNTAMSAMNSIVASPTPTPVPEITPTPVPSIEATPTPTATPTETPSATTGIVTALLIAFGLIALAIVAYFLLRRK